jgi:tetratricopeptide (TPR) repeat protein
MIIKKTSSSWLIFCLIAFLPLSAVISCRPKTQNAIVSLEEKQEIKELFACFSVVKGKKERMEFLGEWIKKYAQSMEAHRAYQDFMTSMGETGALLKEYNEKLAKSPDDPMLNYLCARLQSGPDAELLYQKSLEKDKNYYWGHLGLAYHYFHEINPRKSDLAKEHLEMAIRIDPAKPYAYFSLLTISRAENNSQKRLEVLETLTQLFPKTDYLFLEYADLKFKDRTEHRKALEKKVKQLPDSAQLRKALADLYSLEGKSDKAIRELEEGLAKEKVDKALIQLIHLQLADLFGQKKDAAKTLAHLHEATKLGIRGYDWVKQHPNFEFLKGNKEFEDIVKQTESGIKAMPEKTVPDKTGKSDQEGGRK